MLSRLLCGSGGNSEPFSFPSFFFPIQTPTSISSSFIYSVPITSNHRNPPGQTWAFASKKGKGLAERMVPMTDQGFLSMLEEQETGVAGEEAEPPTIKNFLLRPRQHFPLRVGWRVCSYAETPKQLSLLLHPLSISVCQGLS